MFRVAHCVELHLDTTRVLTSLTSNKLIINIWFVLSNTQAAKHLLQMIRRIFFPVEVRAECSPEEKNTSAVSVAGT